MQDVKTAKVLFLDGKHREAVEMFYECAREGDAEAAFHYAYCLQYGYGTEPDAALARRFYNYAREKVGEANYNLAVMCLHGEGGEVDYRATYSYMYDAAIADIIEAQLYLGVAHTMGTLFEPDIIGLSLIPFHTHITREAIYELSGFVPDLAEDEEARVRAVRFDPHTAFLWFMRAAKHDSDYVEQLAAQSKYLFARCFIEGLGTEFDRTRAEELMLVAAKDGSGEALAFLEENAPYRLAELSDTAALDQIRRVYRLGR